MIWAKQVFTDSPYAIFSPSEVMEVEQSVSDQSFEGFNFLLGHASCWDHAPSHDSGRISMFWTLVHLLKVTDHCHEVKKFRGMGRASRNPQIFEYYQSVDGFRSLHPP